MEEARATQESPQRPIMIWVPEFMSSVIEEAPARPQYFDPFAVSGRRVRVRTVLTPDNYAEVVLPLIEGASDRIYFQNQSLGIAQDLSPEYVELLDALKAKQESNVDVRIILRGEYARGTVEDLKTYGFNVKRSVLRLQDRCHTKGIIVDSDKVLVGSHNWTNSGVTTNRDASFLFEDKEITEHFAKIFLYDWNRLNGVRINESMPAVKIADPTDRPPAGMRLTQLSEFWMP
jgi:phosphatidylserine/phosphatidylglycerophosphate/cardiolipin synthase-like enzyme